MSNYYDYLMEMLLGGSSSPNDINTAESAASQLEDNMLREQLKKRYKKSKHDGRPSGTYAGAEFPGMRYQLWQLESGMMPKLGKWDPGESRQEEAARRKKQEDFARFQRQMLDMGGGQPRRNSTILDRFPRFRG